MAAFPSNIACSVTSGFNESFPKVNRYLGGEKYVHLSTGRVTISIESHSDMELFSSWYIDDISWGVDPFTISLPFFGVIRDWNVRLTKEINTKPNSKAVFHRYISMELEILDDISAYIN
ncbi:MAG: hypothetical protein DRG30_05450 [Epsilonproteobacteria bacterium]|nr:MAG: hypothetical protein DRG30_05450 [Campylobacterota bacterium]